MAGGLTEPYVPGNDCFKDAIFEVVPYLFFDLYGQIISSIIHGEKNAAQFKGGIESLFYGVERFKQLA